MINVDPTELLTAIESIKRHSQIIDEIMSPFLSTSVSNKRMSELRHVANFFVNSELNIKIENQLESPDFIIQYEGQRIGLEHERLFDERLIATTNSISQLFDGAANAFTTKYPGNAFLAEFWLSTDNFTFKKSESAVLQSEIAEFMFRFLRNEETLKPWYIEKVSVTKHSQVVFCFNPGAYTVIPLTPDILNRAIEKKNKLVDKYRTESGIDNQWLLIVIGAISPASFQFSIRPFNMQIKTKFDRIYLMEESHYLVWRLK